jgi:hypothetical protein
MYNINAYKIERENNKSTQPNNFVRRSGRSPKETTKSASKNLVIDILHTILQYHGIMASSSEMIDHMGSGYIKVEL